MIRSASVARSLGLALLALVPLVVPLAFTAACGDASRNGPTPPPEGGLVGPVPLAGGPSTAALSLEEKAAREKARAETAKLRWEKRQQTFAKAGADETYQKAEKEERDQNHKDAADAFTAFAVHHLGDPRAPVALRRAMRGRFALSEFKEGLDLVEDAIVHTENVATKARLHRLLGNTYLAVPHYGVTRGGEFLRAQYGQGRSTQSYREDRDRAIVHLEAARDLMLAHAEPPPKEPAPDDGKGDPGGHSGTEGKPDPQQATAPPEDRVLKTAPLSDDERVETLFELVGAVARFTPYDSQWSYWWYAWASAENDGLVDEEGEDERAGRHAYYSWDQELYQTRPKGLPVTPSGQIVFTKTPTAYAADLDDTGKIKYLLEELRKTDKTTAKEPSGRSVLLQALLFRARDGVERLDRLRNWWWEGSHPFKTDIEERTLHDLKDDEVLGLVATHIQPYTVPPDESVPQLLARLEEDFAKTRAADEGVFLLGQFYQSRQQYDRARAVYRRYVETRPQGSHRYAAEQALRLLEQEEAGILWSGAQPAGRPASVNLRFRNLDAVDLKVRPVDQAKILADFKRFYENGKTGNDDGRLVYPGNLGYTLVHDYYEAIPRYASKVAITLRRDVVPDPEGRYRDQLVDTGLKEPGLYIVEVFPPGKENLLGRGLVMIEGLALVQKRDTRGSVGWVVDAMTGQPEVGATVEQLEFWQDWKDNHNVRHSRTKSSKTDSRGLARLDRTQYQTLTTVKKGDAVTYVGWSYYYGSYSPSRQTDNATMALTFTDRPVYRPGDKVRLKVWARQKRDGVYQPAENVRSLSVTVRDAQNAQVVQETLTPDGWGSAHLEIPLKDDAPLGLYNVQVIVDGSYAQNGGGAFRVEEYKAPEFTVNVKAAGQARLGDKIKAEVQADYLFGGGVAGGKVRYKVYRQDHDHVMLAPGPWDWLYGRGYGLCYYAYGWFDWWGWYGPRPWVWYPWWGEKPEAPRELVKEGEGVLDENGRLKIEIDTAPAKEQRGKSDHKYTVAAEVTDLSRRLIKGEGSITVTRNAFFAHVQSDAGYWWNNQAVALSVMTELPDGEPLAVKGKLVVEEVLYDHAGANAEGAAVGHKPVDVLDVETDTLGATRVTWRPKKTGQYRFTFKAKDGWGTEVQKSTVAWVVGPEWNGRTYRMNGLEVLTDKRVYRPGDTAKLLINVNQAGASVLLATKVDQGVLIDYEVIQVKGKSTFVEIPITEAHVPNFFVEATTVAEGSLFQEAREVFVPPQNAELRLDVTAAKTEYKPGETAELTVKTTDLDGKPVQADVALSVFDTSVLYIQPEMTPDVRQHFWAQKRTHHVESFSSLTRPVQWSENLSHPDRQAYWQLSSAASRFFQHEINWHYAGSEQSLKGADALGKTRLEAQDEDRESERDDAPPAQEATLGLEGNGAGGGGFGAGRAAEKSEMAKESKKDSSARRQAGPASPAPSAAAPMGKVAADAVAPADGAGARGNKAGETGASSSPKAKPTVRRNFADTAHFAPVVRTDENGLAKVTLTLPDNLTTWKVKAIGLGKDTRAGQHSSTLLTTKKILVRLQAPRFFRERDKVVLSAIVHNKYDSTKVIDVVIETTEPLLHVTSKKKQTVKVPPGGEKRVDFWAEVKGEGVASVRMDALADVESDAKELTFPVLVHGMTKTVSKVGSLRARASGEASTDEKSITVDIPEDRRKELSKLIVRYSPTLAGGMLDAIPYLLDYPYGCTEQTLSRFVPAVLTRRALQQAGGVELEALGSPDKKNLNPQQLTPGGKPDQERLDREHKLLSRSPVFDTEILDDIIRVGLTRLKKMQNSDGGWGWWGSDGSSRYTTAHVLAGLLDAQEADLAMDGSMVQRGKYALGSLVEQSLWRYESHEWVGNDDAYAAWVMSRYQQKNEKLLGYLWERRQHLSAYGKLLAAMAFYGVDDKQKAATLLKNAEQILQHDDENETSWLETNKNGWWYWYHDAIETNALYLRTLDTMKKGSDTAPRVVKWLLNHRQNGYYWRSTRDTAAVIAAFANHMQKSGERSPDYDLEVLLDGEVVKTVHIDKTNLFTFDNELVLEGDALSSGEHELTFRRKGKGAVYFNTYLSYFTTEEDVEGTGLEIKVERRYFKLERRDRRHKVQGDLGQTLESTEVAYQPILLESGAKVESGDLILVELLLESKNDYTFLAFEDPKPAGAEPVALRSGHTYGEAVANMELRDEKVVFFLRDLTRGKLKLTYRLRAEIPGEFHAMPTYGFGMYAPELKTNSDEMRLVIEDAP